MAVTTPNKGYALQVTGGNPDTWGDVLNDEVVDPIDTNLGGWVQKDITSANVTLSATEAQNCMLRLIGNVSTTRTVTSPALGFYLVENLCSDLGGAVVLSNGGGVFSDILPYGTRCVVFSDTANGLRLFGYAFTDNPTEIPTGTKMLFTSAAVPTGWTLVTSTTNVGLSISTTGGSTAGSVGYDTLFGRTATDAFTLTDFPAHSHDINSIGSSGTGGGASGTAHWSHRTAVDGTATGTTDNNVGGNQGHTHNIDMRVTTLTTIIGARA